MQPCRLSRPCLSLLVASMPLLIFHDFPKGGSCCNKKALVVATCCNQKPRITRSNFLQILKLIHQNLFQHPTGYRRKKIRGCEALRVLVPFIGMLFVIHLAEQLGLKNWDGTKVSRQVAPSKERAINKKRRPTDVQGQEK